MPGYNIAVESQQLSDVTVEQQGSNISVDGKYTVTVANNGILPIFSGTLSVSELTLFNGAVTAIESDSSPIPRISGGSTKDASVEFSFTEASSNISSQVSSMCSTGSTTATIDGSVSGILLGRSISQTPDETFSLNAGNPNCNLGGSGGELVPPEEQPPPEDDQPPENGGEGGDSGAPPEQGEGSITVLEEPGTDGQAQFRIEGEYDAWFPEFIWDFDDGETETGSREVTHQYTADGTYDVTCTVTDSPTGRTIDEATTRVIVSLSGTPGEDIGGQEIEGPTIVVVDESNTWTYAPEENYDSSEYNITWDMNSNADYDEDQVYEGSFEVDHIYQFQGPKTIQLTVVQSGFLSDDTVVDQTYNVEVLDPSTGGLEAGRLPSMDEAAEAKEREY